MAKFKRCIRRLKKNGVEITLEVERKLEHLLEEGLTENQAVRHLVLASHQNVIDITTRAQEEGATVAPVENPVTDLVEFQAKALTKVKDRQEEIQDRVTELVDRFTDITALEGHVMTRKTPSGVPIDIDEGGRVVHVDLENDQQVLDVMLQFQFRPEEKAGREALGLTGKSANDMLQKFRELQAEKREISDEINKLTKEMEDLGRQTNVIFSGTGPQLFEQAPTPRLTVVHNLSADNLSFSDEMGGMPLPSLALMPEGKVLDNMGEITLIGTENLGDPAEVPVHDADAYTVTYPQPEWKKPTSKAAEPLFDEFRVWAIAMEANRNQSWAESPYRHSVDMTWEYVVNEGSPDKAISEMLRSNGAKQWFLTERYGESTKPVIKDVEPRYAASWTAPVVKFFGQSHSEIENLAWDDPARQKLYLDAGKAFEKGMRIHLRKLYKAAKMPKEEIESLIDDEIQRSGFLEEGTGRLHLSHYEQIKRDVEKKGKKRVSDYDTQEILDKMLEGREAEFQQWVSDKITPLFGEPRLTLNGRKVPYNLENITRKMRAAPLKGSEQTLTFGEGRARAEAATRIGSLTEARNRAEWQIAPDEEVSVARDHAKKLLEDWRNEVINFYGGQTWQGRIDTWNALDASMRALARMVNSQMRMGAEQALSSALRAEEFGDVPEFIVKQGVEAANAWMEAPVPYFEAKPRRAVKLEEFAGAVIPTNATPETRAILQKHRIPFKEYAVGEGIDRRQSRADAVTEFTEQLNNQGERTLFQSELGFTSGLLTAAKVMPREKGTAQEMLGTLRKQPNVKQEELDHLGVEEWAEGKGVFTREELINFIDAGGVQLRETVYAGERIERYNPRLEPADENAYYAAFDDDLRGMQDARFAMESGNLQIYDVVDANLHHDHFFRVYHDTDAGTVNVMTEESYIEEGEGPIGSRIKTREKWFELDEALWQSQLDDAINEYVESRELAPGAKGFAKWTQYTLPAPQLGPMQGIVRADMNHREILLHLPEMGVGNYTLDDLEPTTFGEMDPYATQEHKDRQDSLLWFFDARNPNTGEFDQVFQISKSQYPTREAAAQHIVDDKKIDLSDKNFTSHAYSELNIISWIRLTDRLGPKGESILFIEEVQSDLHQAGLTKGYRYGEYKKLKAAVEEDDLKKEASTMLANLEEPYAGFWSDRAFDEFEEYHREDNKFTPSKGSLKSPFENSLSKKQMGLMRRWLEAKIKSEIYQDTRMGEAYVPDLPWKGDAWAELAIKRVIRMAVEQGYDQVAWTTGEQQVQRYDITEYADKIQWDPRDEQLVTYDEQGRMIESRHVELDELEEWIGAESTLEIKRQMADADRAIDVFAAGFAKDYPGGDEIPPDVVILEEDDQFIDDRSREWMENGLGFLLVDQNGEIVRQSGGDYHMAEYHDGAEDIRQDLIYSGDNIPTLRAVDMVDEEGSGLRKRYDQLMVNVTNRALRKLDKGAKVKRAGLQIEGGTIGHRMTIESDGKTFYVEAHDERTALDSGERRQISPRFDTFDEADEWRLRNSMGYANTVHGFDITAQMMTVAMEGQTYFQRDDQSGGRGSITFDEEGAAIIRLTQAKDLSTFLHESAHLYLELMGDLVEVTHADPRLIDDYYAILKFLGVNNRHEIQTRHHELFARSFEAYIREGKAPTAELAPIFAAYSGWLTQVYGTIRKLLRPHEQLTDEIRGVFDRMVASEQAITDSEDMMAYVQLYQSAEEMGVSQEVFDVYKRDMQEAHDAEVDKLTRKTLKSMQWAKQQWWKDELKKVAAEVRREAEQMPVYRAMAMLMRGKNPDGSDPVTNTIKLDKADLVERYGKDFLKRLPGRGKNLVYTLEGGTDADIAANTFGFEDADEMIKALIDAPKMEQWIKDESERRMKELHPDPLNDPDLINEVAKQVHTTQRSKILGKELRALRKKMAEDKAIVKATKAEAKRQDKEAMEANKGQLPKRENMAQIKAAAAQLIAKKRVRDVNPNSYLMAERKAGRLAFQALERKDYAKAYEHKLAQIMNFEAYRAAVRAKTQTQRDHKYLTSFNKKAKQQRMGKAGYLERILKILEDVDLRKISLKQIDREKIENELKAAIDDGSIVTTPEIADMLDNPGGTNWKDMTVEELGGIRDVIKQLEHQARLDLEVIINGEKMVIQEKVDEVAASIIENHDQVPPVLTEEGRFKSSVREAVGHWLRSSSIARVLDKSGFGAVTRNIIVPIRRAMVEKLLPWQHKAAEDVAAIYKKHYSNKELGKLGKKIPGKIMGQSWAKSDILALALHWGTQSGREAVLGGVLEDAYGNRSAAYTQEGVAAALALMDARDWAFVQDIWDYQESYWDQLKETEERRRGIAPQKVESLPFTIRTVDGEEVSLRGGYHHLQYMHESGRMSEQEFQDYYNKMQKGSFLSSSTRAGATYNRSKDHGRVIKLTLNTIDQNLREILRDMALGDEVNLANRILNHRDVANAAKNTNNAELLQELKLWLSDAAVGELPAQTSIERALSWFRVGFTKSKLAFNVYVTLLQLTGAFQSMAVIGSAQYMRGLGKFLTNPAGNYKMVMEESAFMNARYGVMQAFDKDVADTKAFLQSYFGGVPTKFARSMDTVGHYYFWPIAKMQSVVDVTTWMAAYEQAMNDPKIGNKEDAKLYADAQVERAQTSGLFSDRSGIERGTLGTRTRQGQFVRLWTVLISYMLAKGNIAYEKGKITDFKDPKQAIGFAVDMVLLFLIEGMASALLYGRWPGEEDEDETVVGWAAKATVESVASGIPMLREYSGAKYGSGTTPIGALTVDLWKTIEQISQGDVDEPAVKATVKTMGTLFHLPSSQVNRAVEAMFKEGDAELHEWFMGVDEE